MIGLTTLAAGLLAFGCYAGLLLAWRARRALGWEVSYRLSVLSHIGMAAIILFVALWISAAAGALRLLGEEGGVALGLVVFLVLWRAGVAVLVQWFATRPSETILITFRLRRLERFAYLVTVSGVIVAGLLLALLKAVISHGYAEFTLLKRTRNAVRAAGKKSPATWGLRVRRANRAVMRPPGVRWCGRPSDCWHWWRHISNTIFLMCI